MIFSFYNTGDYPVLIDPEDHEYRDSRILKAWKGFDSLRGVSCKYHGIPHIAIASGYGHTHNSLHSAICKAYGYNPKRLYTDKGDFIIRGKGVYYPSEVEDPLSYNDAKEMDEFPFKKIIETIQTFNLEQENQK